MFKKILITGCNGTIGYELCKQIKTKFQDVTIHGIDRVNFNNQYLDEFYNDCISNINQYQLKNYNYIFHAASTCSPLLFEEEIDNNILCNINFLNQIKSECIQNNIKLIFFSTSEVYNNEFKEDTYSIRYIPKGGRSLYILTKLAGENIIKTTYTNYLILRIFNTYSNHYHEFDTRIMPSIINCIKNRTKLKIYNNGNSVRSMCHVEDCVEMIIKSSLMLKNDIINIGNDKEIYTVNEIVNTFKKYFNIETLNVNAPIDNECIKRICNIEKYRKYVENKNNFITLNNFVEILKRSMI